MIGKRARVLFAGLVAAAITSTTVLVGGPAVAAPAAPPGPPPARTLEKVATVTLVTGDVVTLGGANGVDVRAGKGREHLEFRSFTDERGDVHVIPEDAVTGVSSGRLDPRLFDVSGLVRAGYDDAGRRDLPLIVDYPGATPRAAGFRAVRELPVVSAVAVRADRSTAFWAGARTAASRIWLDGQVRASLEHSVPQIGAPEAWEAGFTGAGTTVAVLDTGIDSTHPDLADAVREARDFSESESGADDRFGHGTHVASIITGAGERYRGVAPDAALLNGKVLDDFGLGSESGIIAGMEWAADSGADVVNMSLSAQDPAEGTDLVSLAVNRISAETGALFVVAAGNTGPSAESITAPGAADAALTVGAVDREDELAEFSSRGPRWGSGAIKPDITAPGVDIVAAKAAHGVIGDPVEDGYVAMSGTSMATPHVAGAAAILAQRHPEWTGEALKATLMSSAKPHPELSVFEQGGGRVDVPAAARAAVTAFPASLSLGTVQWPHQDDEPVTGTLTYRNTGTEPVTLNVVADLRGPNGEAAPEGMFTLSADEITVPAGGSTEVTLTTNTRVEAVDGIYSGVVVASAGDTVVRTPVAVNREVESYEVTMRFVGDDGNPTPNYQVRLVNLTVGKAYLPYEESGTVAVRVPKGEYFMDAAIQGNETANHFVEPRFSVTGPTEETLDPRDGVPMGVSVDDPDARVGFREVAYKMTTKRGTISAGGISHTFDGTRVRPSRTSAPGAFTIELEAHLAEPDGTEEGSEFHASPYLYHVWHTDDSGRVPDDLQLRFTNDQFAKVVSQHAVATPGMMGSRDGMVTMPLPYTLTEYYTPDVRWDGFFDEIEHGNDLWPSGLTSKIDTPRTFRLGTTTRERWNVGVFGPGLIHGDGWDSIDRRGNEIYVNLGLHSDGNPSREGVSLEATGSTQLLRDGEVIAESQVPGYVETRVLRERADYTLRATATQPGPLSTRIDAEWTFASEYVAGDTPVPIPALAMRFSPNLDDHNAAKAGKRFRFPVHVQRNGAEQPGEVDTPRLEVSYDDGKTWRPSRLSRERDHWVAEVNHPKDAEFVSLRSSVSDRNGTSLKQTILHAYALN
ncbi:S8 family peptidase [Actinophytocola xanthii]|uniref:Peptidase S8/S53 domain-containing protein n=1 Tax=Actinophytocola xanthii TaxID=1912961 RepID=A0A1Q8CXN0_9PSEU|nr:S8 family serine peptidase [Actinophytocola xanthii]OLF19102.1 hypothetical protein BU204_03055 [Actinophytocola xanthii]